jgi:exopolysaccharide biosynthesis polyprenyl glycosylphosphotransferase
MTLPIPPARSGIADPAMGVSIPDELATPQSDPDARSMESAPLQARAAGLENETADRTSQRTRRRSGASPEVRLRVRLFRTADVAVILAVLSLVFIATNLRGMPEGPGAFLGLRITLKNLLLLCAFALSWPVLCAGTRLYDPRAIRNSGQEAQRVVATCALLSLVALAFPTISVTGAFRYSTVLYFGIGSSIGIVLCRTLIRGLVPVSSGITRNAVIIGTGPRAQRLYQELDDAPDGEYNILGFLDSSDRVSSDNLGSTRLGDLEELEDVLMRHALDEVLIALPIKSRYADIQRVLESCQRIGVRAKFGVDLFETTRCVGALEDDRVSVIAAPRSPQGWRLVTKRCIDVIGALVGLLLLWPVLLVAAVAIRLTSPGPVFFTQSRYGFNRRLFKMYKLRTMVADADALQAGLEARNEASGPVFKIQDDPRITTVGRWLRRTSVDELPQLYNVLRGDMSLVGPRPLPIRDVNRFEKAALMRRFSVRPGLTCLWQTSGRSALTFEDWIRLDLQYIDEWCMRLDLWILLRTIPIVVKGTGAS